MIGFSKIFIGNQECSKMYLGSSLIWQNTPIVASDKVLLYTTTDGDIAEPYDETAFGTASIISNIYSGNVGVMTFDNAVTKVDNNAFRSISRLKTVSLPTNVKAVGNYAFISCSNLEEITLPESVRTIGISAFRNTSLEKITIPSLVESISDYAFKSCNELTEITFMPTKAPTVGIDWLSDVEENGTIIIRSGSTGYSEWTLPSGWTLQEA